MLPVSISPFRTVYSLEGKIEFATKGSVYFFSTFLRNVLSGRNVNIWGKWVYGFAWMKTCSIIQVYFIALCWTRATVQVKKMFRIGGQTWSPTVSCVFTNTPLFSLSIWVFWVLTVMYFSRSRDEFLVLWNVIALWNCDLFLSFLFQDYPAFLTLCTLNSVYLMTKKLKLISQITNC